MEEDQRELETEWGSEEISQKQIRKKGWRKKKVDREGDRVTVGVEVKEERDRQRRREKVGQREIARAKEGDMKFKK